MENWTAVLRNNSNMKSTEILDESEKLGRRNHHERSVEREEKIEKKKEK